MEGYWCPTNVQWVFLVISIRFLSDKPQYITLTELYVKYQNMGFGVSGMCSRKTKGFIRFSHQNDMIVMSSTCIFLGSCCNNHSGSHVICDVEPILNMAVTFYIQIKIKYTTCGYGGLVE